MNTKTDLKLSLALEELLFDNATRVHQVLYENTTQTLFVDGWPLDVYIINETPIVKREELNHLLNQL